MMRNKIKVLILVFAFVCLSAGEVLAENSQPAVPTLWKYCLRDGSTEYYWRSNNPVATFYWLRVDARDASWRNSCTDLNPFDYCSDSYTSKKYIFSDIGTRSRAWVHSCSSATCSSYSEAKGITCNLFSTIMGVTGRTLNWTTTLASPSLDPDNLSAIYGNNPSSFYKHESTIYVNSGTSLILNWSWTGGAVVTPFLPGIGTSWVGTEANHTGSNTFTTGPITTSTDYSIHAQGWGDNGRGPQEDRVLHVIINVDNGCAANTCTTTTCNNGIATVAGTKICADNSCAANTCNTTTCWNKLTWIPGTRVCNIDNGCAANTCSTTTCYNSFAWVQGTKLCDNGCAANTCNTTTCWNNLTWISGTKVCADNSCATNTCTTATCWNNLAWISGTKVCDNGCAANTCNTTICNNGVQTVQGTKVCADNSCAANTCNTTTCWNNLTWISGTKVCADNSCAALTCKNTPCWNNIDWIPGTKVCDNGCAAITCKGQTCDSDNDPFTAQVEGEMNPIFTEYRYQPVRASDWDSYCGQPANCGKPKTQVLSCLAKNSCTNNFEPRTNSDCGTAEAPVPDLSPDPCTACSNHPSNWTEVTPE